MINVAPALNFACPLDGLALAAEANTLRCPTGHCFDRAKEGYCNLLVVQHKASRDPGDSREMVAARRRFVDAQHFAPITEHLFGVVQQAMTAAAGRTLTVLDAGCGEGYTLDRLAVLAQQSTDHGTIALAGIDVSKWAIKAAARRKSPVTWLVANNARPPFLAGSVDLILCLFGFPVWDGFKSVQRSGSQVVLVDPGPDHLIELREIIYPSVTRAPPAPVAVAEPAGHRLTREERLQFPITLARQDPIQDLLAMTPHGHRITEAGRGRLAQMESLAVTVDVVVRTLILS